MRAEGKASRANEDLHMTRAIVLSALVFGFSALAQGTEGPGSDQPTGPIENLDTPEAKAAKDVVTKYLNDVKAKKWDAAKKSIHPKTIEAIAERKKRLGKEDHPMAPWYFEKVDHYLKEFKVVGAKNAPIGTIVVETREDNFRVEEKGIAHDEMAAYLVGKKDGKWFIADKKRLESFPNDSVKIGYKGYFDKVEKKTE
jgi:hypothetical protein